MSDPSAEQPRPRADGEQPTPSPARAFSQGVGFIMQSVGAVFVLFMTCGCCVLTFLESGRMHEMGADAIAYSDVPGAYLALMTVAGVGGFCLMGFGIGQQADRGQRPAIANASTATISMLISGIAAFTLYRSGEPVGVIVFGLVIFGVMTLLTALGWPAVVAVMRDPVPWHGPPTVPAEEYADPWSDATKQAKKARLDAPPTKEDLIARRKKLLDELAELDDLEQRAEGDGTDSRSRPDNS